MRLVRCPASGCLGRCTAVIPPVYRRPVASLVVVSVDDDPDKPQDDAEAELTAEQRERLRKSMDSLSRAIVPIDLKLHNLLSPAFSKLAADMVRLPAFKLQESTLKNLTVMSGIAEAARSAQLTMTSAMKPFLDQQALWIKQFQFINSDVFNSVALAQSNLNAIAAQLTKNVDFGLSGPFAKLAQQIAAQQSSWLKDLGPTLATFKLSFYPPNLRDIDRLRLEEVEEVVMVDGIALYSVPRTAIAEALIRADGASKRRDILGRRWKAISADCRTAAGTCKSEAVAPYQQRLTSGALASHVVVTRLPSRPSRTEGRTTTKHGYGPGRSHRSPRRSTAGRPPPPLP